MARLPALIDAFVKIDGRDRATIEHTARVIREGGLIPTTKRGAGASSMTSAEAVNLLLALNGTYAPREGADAVMRYRQLYCRSKASEFEDDEVLKPLYEIANFGEALEWLIDWFPDVAASYGKDVMCADGYFFDAFTIDIEIHFGRAAIRVGDRETRRRVGFSRTYHFEQDAEYPDRGSSDRRVVVYLSARTVFELWHCIYDGRPAEPV